MNKLTQTQSRQVNPKRNIPDVVIRIDANGIDLKVKGVTAAFCPAQLVLVQVRPAPNSRVNYVREALSTGNLPNGNFK